MFSLQGEFSPGDSVVGHPGDLGELFLSVNSLNKVVRILTTFYTPPLR